MHENRALCVVRLFPFGVLLDHPCATEQVLERHMSYRDILLLRKEARGWRLEDMGDEPPENPPLDPELMSGVRETDPQARRFVLQYYSCRDSKLC